MSSVPTGRETTLGQLIDGYVTTQLLYVAAKLGVADVLAEGPRSGQEIADAVGADPDATHLFTGDSLFPGGVGATFGDADAFRQLVDEVSTKLFGTLDDDTWFYPGHGDDGRLGDERPHLEEWRARGW